MQKVRTVFLAGCMLDQNLMAPKARREDGHIRSVVDWCEANGIVMHAMPCPETELVGLGRPTNGKKWYEEHGLRPVAERIARQQAAYLKTLDGVIGIIMMNFSPSCSALWMYKGRGRGNVREDGIYVEELKKAIVAEGLELPPFVSYAKHAHKRLKADLAELLAESERRAKDGE